MRKKQDTAEIIAELNIEKSNLLLEARMLEITEQTDQAIERYARVAPMEERIAAFYEKQGDPIMAARSWFSAATCYVFSGSHRDALRLYDMLGRGKDTLGYYKTDALMWSGRLRQQQREMLKTYGKPPRDEV